MATYKKMLKDEDGNNILPVVTVETNMIQNNAVTSSKIDYDILVSGALLACAQNQTRLDWSGTSKTEWTLGTWTQFGMFARTSGNMNRIKITTPEDEDWQICVRHQTSHCKINSNYAWSGIKDITDGKYKSGCLTANGELYLSQQSEFFETIPAGTTKEYGVFVFTSNSNQCIWYGGGDSTDSGTGFNFGKSCILKATLVRRIKT